MTPRSVRFGPFLLSCVALLLGMQVGCAERVSEPVASQGVLDLRGWSFEADGALQLAGDWELCWDALLEPGAAGPEPGSCRSMRVPGLWTDRNAAPGEGVGTYRLRILLPPEHPPLSLRVGAPLTAHRLFIDGRSVPGTGQVARTREGTASIVQNRIHVLPDGGDEIHLLVQVANFDFRSGGLRRRWILGSRDDVRSWSTAVTVRDTTLATVNLLVGLFFLGFFASRPKDRTTLYFGLAGVALALRAIPGNYSDFGQFVAPTLTFPAVLRMEYFLNNFMVFAGIGYFAHKVPRDMPPRLAQWIGIGSVAGMLGALFLPLSLTSIAMRSAWVLGAGMLAASLYALVLAARRGEPFVRITLTAVPLCLAVVLWDSVRAEGAIMGTQLLPDSMLSTVLTESVALFPLSILALVLTEAVVLMRAFARSYDTIESLSEDLIESNEDLRETNQAVTRFVPFDFLRLLEKESIRDVERGDCVGTDMSIMFCDIRSFTSHLESLTPEESFGFVNSFTEWMEPAIHGQGGFINQYLGDCIMALFPAGSDAAVRAGLGMLAAVEELNRTEGKDGRRRKPIRVGIGINSGPLMVGTIGGRERLEHAVIGDSVNLTARVESLTKLYGANFLISGSTHEGLTDPSAYESRLLDRVVVKGRSEPVPIHEILDGLDPETRERRLATRERFEKARLAYENRAFAEAESLFAECLAQAPEDAAAKLYIERCRKLAVEGVPPGWRGETVLTKK